MGYWYERGGATSLRRTIISNLFSPAAFSYKTSQYSAIDAVKRARLLSGDIMFSSGHLLNSGGKTIG